MTSNTFFRCCKELVAVRWKFSVGKFGELRLHHLFFMADIGGTPAIRPLQAVAIEVCGISPLNPESLLYPAERLGLKDEFAHLVEKASSAALLDKDASEVREQLICFLAITHARRIYSVDSLKEQGLSPSHDGSEDDDTEGGEFVTV
ncbi:MAG: hypothetical protein A3H57_01820 [Candidatus Taylorbacteria bacterium RIFCSPLOWO2_02_FULL_43_11]|nr:MAG: hypothetical protein A2743_00440 [Candidatus Taylorbacteria bacterium RIFCSPHIGHO2_01_FULL_43_47]OHA30926.1 MAG: hypothetical protein A3B08_03955 [Candidatus Taylorbacteria bacterium RIFCSPLOWO2_01_FULL_43_44]OHA37614.1 MAG: hypothetical protein A3H57_01820 [Candidatus Taylorbacteria bacterium RIFCSPLOWO2_02_FULL_43_11]